MVMFCYILDMFHEITLLLESFGWTVIFYLFIFFFQSKCTLKPNRNAQTILGLLQTVVDCTQIIKTAYLKYEGKHVLHVASAG